MVRTQIYLTEDLKAGLDRLSSEQHVTISELIRHALQQFLERKSSDFEEALERSFGIWSKKRNLGKTSVYVRKMRKEWEKRERRNLK